MKQDGVIFLTVTSPTGVARRFSFDTGRVDDSNVHDVRVVRDGRQVRYVVSITVITSCVHIDVITLAVDTGSLNRLTPTVAIWV